ncbi:dockerin type I repeat-containing protein [Ruminococcus sp.]|uniref:dockerin type I repeat-containing protein n=1 Tax=Ruminococcus sp. TaxID=41978 RepID=UPI0025E098E1|nr:dockerin type I repeat-containing protein [Ruminococcus sp.]
MNSIKKKLLSLVLAAGMTFSALPVSAYADNEKIQGRQTSLSELYSNLNNDPSAYDEYYGSATLEEVLAELCGDYVPLSSSNGISFPYKSNNGSFCIDETGKARNFYIYYPVTVIEVTEGTELPVEEIQHESAEMGFKPPQLTKVGNTYRLKEVESQDALFCVLNQLADCENVVSVTENIALYEDTANYVSMYGIYIGKAKLSESEMAEFLDKMSALDPQESTSDASLAETRKKGYRYFFSFGENRSREQKDIYEAYKYLADTGLSYETMWYKTLLAMPETPVYFCHRDYTVGQKYDYEKPPVISETERPAVTESEESEQKRENLSDVWSKVKRPTPELDAQYKAMTLDEAFDDFCGSYIDLSSYYEDELYPSNREKIMFKVDDNGRTHIAVVRGIETVVKVREGTELPIEQLFEDIKTDGRNTLTISKNNDTYRIRNAPSKDVMNVLLEKLKKCDNVVSIEEHYVVYEDWANYPCYSELYIDSRLPEGSSLTKEDILENLATLDLKEMTDDTYIEYLFRRENDWAFLIGDDRSRDGKELYNAIKYLADNGISYDLPCGTTELAIESTKVYYCSRPVLINGLSGDANADGELDMSDAVMIMQSLANPNKYGIKAAKGITAQGLKNADANGDGLTTNDALAIQEQLLGLSEKEVLPPDCAEPSERTPEL